MDIAWIQVFVLTLSECVAPAGKTVCQEQTLELQFLTQADCEVALQQLVSLKQESESVIIDPANASCAPTARQRQVFASLDAIEAANQGKENWQAPSVARRASRRPARSVRSLSRPETSSPSMSGAATER